MKRNIWLAIVVVTLLASGCSRHADAAVPQTTAPITLPQATTTALGARTAGSLADAGAEVYQIYCSGCHGINGVNGFGGVTLIGPGSGVYQYGTVSALLLFLSQGRPFAMPYENPRNITPEQLNQVTAYLVVQNGLVPRSTPWENLSSIILQ